MQFLWKYIDDLVGKGLEWFIVVKLLTYASASLVPLALPLAMLLSSIMTFGNFGEQYELTAMKSAGISLRRIMMPLIILTSFISIAAFYFSNNILPIANLKFGTLLYDITHQKPAIDIKDGIFYNGIDGYSIRISKKEDHGNLLKNLIIYDHTQKKGNNKVITAESGRMEITSNKDFLVLTLYDGKTYEEKKPDNNQINTLGFLRTTFKEQVFRIELTDFNLNKTDEDLFKDNYAMLNLSQLNLAIKEMENENLRKQNEFKVNFGNNFLIKRIENDSLAPKQSVVSNIPEIEKFSSKLTKSQQHNVLESAVNMARNAKSQIEAHKENRESSQKYINKHLVEWHRKFTLSFACIVLFFIGAPFGAIIRKGGLGMPLVITVILFIVFHVLSITGEKFVKEGVFAAPLGMWLASSILLPFGIYITYKASKEANIFDLSFYSEIIEKIKNRKNKV